MSEDDRSMQESLTELADVYTPGSDPDYAVLRLDKWWIDAHLKGPDVLELGCADGTTTELLIEKSASLDVVDGARRYCDIVRERFNDAVSVYESFYEDFEPPKKYDDVVFARSLDDVMDPVAVLTLIRGWLKPGGRLHIVVQNAESLHRRVGKAIGALQRVDEVSDHSRSVAHRRVYTRELLLAHCAEAGFQVSHFEGFFLKPLDYKTLQASDSDFETELVPALFEIGKRVPDDLCCQLYAMCRAD